MEDRPVPAWSYAALLACGLLLLAACAPARLADLPDRPAGGAVLQRAEASSRQPIAPTFVSKDTRIETVRVMLSISQMGTRPYDLEEIYQRLDPSLRAGVQRLRAIGTDGDVEFREVLDQLAHSIGACVVPIARFVGELRYDGGPVVIVAPVKGERRILEKTLTHNLGDVSLVQDLVRGSVAVDHPDDVRVVANRTLEMLRQRGVEIVEIEDHFASAGAGGYRDFQINFRLPRSRVIGELQLHVKDLLVVKQRVGHGVYERARLACAAMEMGITSADVNAVCTRNGSEMAASYERAYRRSASRPRIHSRPCAPVAGSATPIRTTARSSGRPQWRGARQPMPPAARLHESRKHFPAAELVPGN